MSPYPIASYYKIRIIIIYTKWQLPGVGFIINCNKFYIIVCIFIYYKHLLRSSLIIGKLIKNHEKIY